MTSHKDVEQLVRGWLDFACAYKNSTFLTADLKKRGITTSKLDLLTDHSSPLCTPLPCDELEQVYKKLPDRCKQNGPRCLDTENHKLSTLTSDYHTARRCEESLIRLFDSVSELEDPDVQCPWYGYR